MNTIINNLLNIISGDGGGGIIALLISIATAVFLWGVFKYVLSDDSEGRKKAVGIIAYGLIFLFIMVSVWGLVRLIGDTLGITNVNMKFQQNQSLKNLIR